MIEPTRWIPALAYLAAAVFSARQLLWPQPGPNQGALREPPKVGPWCLMATLAHLTQLVALSISRQRLPYGTMWEAISVAVAVLMLSYLLLERLARSDALGTPFLVLASIGTGFSALHSEPARWPIHARSGLFLTHVSLGISGLALLTSASLLAAAWLWQYRQLRNKHFTSLSRRVPDLATLDRLFAAASTVGAILLGLGGMLGVLWMRTWGLPIANETAKSLSVILALVWNAGIAMLRQRGKFSLQTTAWLGFAGIAPVFLVLWAGTSDL